MPSVVLPSVVASSVALPRWETAELFDVENEMILNELAEERRTSVRDHLIGKQGDQIG
jgi:hypothetical protein